MAIKAEWSAVPYVGSFQNGRLFNNGMPLDTAWGQLSRLGTVENLSRICTQRRVNKGLAFKASLRFQQAIELRKASRNLSIMTRPLLLYYSALNAVRGLLLAYTGDMGGRSHGLSYCEGGDLLRAGAKIAGGGTFVTLAKALKQPMENLAAQPITLGKFLSYVPELAADQHILSQSSANIPVTITAYFDPEVPVLLEFSWRGSPEDFSSRWAECFPALSDKCRLSAPLTLQVIKPLHTYSDVSQFCYENLQDNLYWTDTPQWWAVAHLPSSIPWQRLMSYIGALFVLASVVRYEPELLQGATRDPSDVAYLLTTFLDHAERLLPQMVLAIAISPRMYFV